MISLLFAVIIELTPKYGYIGELPMLITGFSYSSGTRIEPITRIGTDPFVEQYGPSSVIPAGSGAVYGPCWVKSITQDGSGSTFIHCEVYRDD